MTLTTLNPGLDPIHVESGLNTFITRNGTSPCRHIPVTDVPSEKSSKWSTPMWAKNIIPNAVVRNMVFFELFRSYFYNLFTCFIPSTLFSLSFTLQEKTIRVLLIHNVAEHNVQLQRATRFKRYLRGLASG